MSNKWLLLIHWFSFLACLSCDHFFEGPITISKYNQITNDIFVSDEIEISFELQVNNGCSDRWCNFFLIGQLSGTKRGGIRLPLLALNGEHNNFLHVPFSINTYYNNQINYHDQYLNNTIFDGNYHTYFFRFSYKERIFMFDNIIYNNFTNGKYNSTQLIYKQYPLYLAWPNQYSLLNGTFKNVCVNSTTYPNQINDQSFIEQSILTPLHPYDNGVFLEILNNSEVFIKYSNGWEWQINDTDHIGHNMKISFNDTKKWTFPDVSVSSLQLVINSNYDSSSTEQNLLITISISSIKYLSLIINMDNGVFGLYPDNIIYPFCDDNINNPEQQYALGNAELISNTNNSETIIDKLFHNDTKNYLKPTRGDISVENIWPLILNIINDPIKNYSMVQLINRDTNIMQSCSFNCSIRNDDDISVLIATTAKSELYGFGSIIINKYIHIPTESPTENPTTMPTKSPTENPTMMPTKQPTATIYPSLINFIQNKNASCVNLVDNVALEYDQSLIDCINDCKNSDCKIFNYFENFKEINDSRCYVFDKLCNIEMNTDYTSIVGYFEYNRDCLDYPHDWVDNTGDNCNYYVSHDWCLNNVLLKNENDFNQLADIKYGLTAKRSCCECGGGIYEMDDVGFSIDNNWTYHEDILCKWNNSALTSHLFSNNNNTTLRSWDNIILYNLCSNLFDEINCNFLLDMKFQSLNEIYSLYWCTDSTSTDNTNSFHFILDIITNDTNYNIYVNSLWFNLDLSYYSSNVNIIPLNYSDCVDRMFSINRNNTTKHGTHPCYVMDTIHPTILPTNVPTKYPTKNPTENPTKNPTKNPTNYPTNYPTKQPTKNRTQRPTYDPTDDPTANPSLQPSFNPTVYPSRTPSKYPFGTPTFIPTDIPIATKYPTVQPILNPTVMTTDTNTDYNNEFESGEISMNSKTCNTNSTLTVIMAIIIGICMIGVVVLILIIIVITKSKKNNPVHLQMSVQPEYTKKQDKEGIYTGISCGEIKKRQKDSTYRSACNEINTSDNNLPVFTD
eukprot:26318_1